MILRDAPDLASASERSARPTFTLTLIPTADCPDATRALLKFARRRLWLRAVSVREIGSFRDLAASEIQRLQRLALWR